MPQEDFETGNPVRWWHQQRAQFLNLYHLARDIFSIPGIFFCTYLCVYSIFIRIVGWVLGSAVAVKRIFSGGRETISLRRASLKPEATRVLMLVKHQLILTRRSVQRDQWFLFLPCFISTSEHLFYFTLYSKYCWCFID